MKRIAIIIWALAPGLLAADPVLAGAWVQPPETAYARAFGAHMSTVHRYDFTGAKVPIEGDQTYSETSAALFFATGLTRNVELNVASTIKRASLTTAGTDSVTTGLGDLWLATKFGLGTDWVVRSLELRLKVPTGYDELATPPLGDGQIDVEVRGLWGLSLWTVLRAYAGLEFGYRYRSGDPGDMLILLAEFGGNIYPDLGYRLKLDLQHAIDIPRSNQAVDDLFALNTRATRLEAVVWIALAPGLYLEGGGVKLLDARNFTGGDSYGVALARVWDFGSP
jgi:hypothetical protein